MIYWKQEKWFKAAKVKFINNSLNSAVSLEKNKISILKPRFESFPQMSRGPPYWGIMALGTTSFLLHKSGILRAPLCPPPKLHAFPFLERDLRTW